MSVSIDSVRLGRGRQLPDDDGDDDATADDDIKFAQLRRTCKICWVLVATYF